MKNLKLRPQGGVSRCGISYLLLLHISEGGGGHHFICIRWKVDILITSYPIIACQYKDTVYIFIIMFSEKFILHIKTFENVSKNCCWDFPWVTQKMQLKNLHATIYQSSLSGLKHCCNCSCIYNVNNQSAYSIILFT